jgi:polyhydroxyalkanoate synthase
MSFEQPTPRDDAPQHAPRPLPLFLSMLRSETAASPARRAAALAGLARYQAAERPAPPPPLPCERRHGRARLIGTGGGTAGGRTVVLIPSLINPPTILDLSVDASLLRWLGAQGHVAWLLDWGTPGSDERDLDIAGHVERLLMPLLATLDEPPVLVGYCLGGTIAAAAATLMRVAGLATIAMPWRFAGYGGARDGIARHWAGAQDGCAAMGLVPMELLQTGFWMLDPARTIAKYEAFATMADAAAVQAFVRLEDWANAGPPLTLAAGRELFEAMVAADRPGRGQWQVAGRAIDPHRLPCPAVEFVSLTDRIVPAATAAGLADRRDVAAGHVGMMVGSKAKAGLWDPLADWIARLPRST